MWWPLQQMKNDRRFAEANRKKGMQSKTSVIRDWLRFDINCFLVCVTTNTRFDGINDKNRSADCVVLDVWAIHIIVIDTHLMCCLYWLPARLAGWLILPFYWNSQSAQMGIMCYTNRKRSTVDWFKWKMQICSISNTRIAQKCNHDMELVLGYRAIHCQKSHRRMKERNRKKRREVKLRALNFPHTRAI